MDAKPAGPQHRRGATALSSAVGSAVDKTLHSLTQLDVALPLTRVEKTKPPTPPGGLSHPKHAAASLSPRHLAAVRLFATGMSVTDVAARLKVSRQSLWTWRRQPAFSEELRRIHEQLVTSEAGHRREFRQQQHERLQRRDDALIERLIRDG